MKIVNCYSGGPSEGWSLVLVKPDGSTERRPCVYSYYVDRPGGGYERVDCRTWKDRDARVRSETRKTYESDLSPIRRMLAEDTSIEIAKPTRAYIDLETDPTLGFQYKHNMRILVACAVGDDGDEFTGVLEDLSDDAERRMLSAFFKFLTKYNQVVAWNGGSAFGNDGFDFVVLRGACERLWPGSSRRLNKWLWIDQLRAYKKLHLMFAETGEERASYSLDNVSHFVLGEGKIEYDAKQTLVDWQKGGVAREDLKKYCQQDTRLLPRIEAKTGVLDLAYQVSKLCGVLHDTTGLGATTFFDQFLLRLAGRRGMRLPNKPYDPGQQKRNFAGAFVFEPNATGIEKNVISIDFASLYPSLFIFLNASPETKGKPGCVSPATGVTFAQEPLGIVPEALIELGKMKKAAKDEYKRHPEGSPEYLKAKSYHDAVKSIVNSGYGYSGSKFTRLYDKDVSESITLSGQFLIKSVAKAVEAKGWRMVMGDTDSAYVSGCTETEMREFLKYCNEELLPGIQKAHHCVSKPPSIEFDHHFERLVVVGKKKYLGRYHNSTEYDVKGLEWRRGDSSPLARKLQEKVSKKLMEDRSEDPEDFLCLIVDAQNQILEGTLELKDVVLSESLGKELDAYDGVSPAVSVAKELRSRGEDIQVGSKIKFIVVDGSVSPISAIPACDWSGAVDRHYTWQNLVYPPTQRLLEAAFPTYDWSRWAKTRPTITNSQKKQQRLEILGQCRLPNL